MFLGGVESDEWKEPLLLEKSIGVRSNCQESGWEEDGNQECRTGYFRWFPSRVSVHEVR